MRVRAGKVRTLLAAPSASRGAAWAMVVTDRMAAVKAVRASRREASFMGGSPSLGIVDFHALHDGTGGPGMESRLFSVWGGGRLAGRPQHHWRTTKPFLFSFWKGEYRL